MLPTAYPLQFERLKTAWRAFVAGEEGDLAWLDPLVLQSWRRCRPRFDPYARPRPGRSGEQTFAAVLKAQADLLAIATPFMEDVHQFIEGSGCAVLLTDGAGCVLTVTGDPAGIALVESMGIEQGCYCSDGHFGTNAPALALIEATPTQVVGAEHYFATCHHLATTAAPIHEINGRIIGLLTIVGLVATATPHTLGLVMAAARAIGNQLQTDLYLQEANRHLSEVNTVLSLVSEGVISCNQEGRIKHVNVPAGQMFQLPPQAVLGHPIQEVLAMPPILVEAIQHQQGVVEAEATIQANHYTVNCLATLRPVLEGGRAVGIILLLRPIEQVRRLVQQQFGTQATLTLDDMAGDSPTMRQVIRQARIAARGMAPVLIRGEGGVGKNPLARAIHNESPRAGRPFLAINCQAIPHELMVSEFLGHEENGVSPGRPSKFELANDGTLLLDQFESLSLEMQATLLHLIDTGHLMRLGSTRPVAINVRLIAATSANLEQLVAEGSLLPHLYYRFGVFNITMPALRERIDDLPLLAERFLSRITQSRHRAVWISDEAMAILRRYPWPGNVRELENVLERAIHQSRDSTIRLTDLPELVRTGRVLTTTTPQPQPILTLADAEREAILRAGWACQGHLSEMAQHLGIGRTTLWRKLKELRLDPNQFKR